MKKPYWSEGLARIRVGEVKPGLVSMAVRMHIPQELAARVLELSPEERGQVFLAGVRALQERGAVRGGSA